MTAEHQHEEPPAESVTINQVVAWNMAWFRKTAGMTQAELGEKLGGWSVAAVSAAERSWDGKPGRTREFDAHTLITLAGALGVPLVALFLPPGDDGERARYLWDDGGSDRDMATLAGRLLPDSGDETPVMSAYRDRLTEVTRQYLQPGWDDTVKGWMSDSTKAAIRAGQAEQLRWDRDALLSAAENLGRIADAIERTGKQ